MKQACAFLHQFSKASIVVRLRLLAAGSKREGRFLKLARTTATLHMLAGLAPKLQIRWAYFLHQSPWFWTGTQQATKSCSESPAHGKSDTFFLHAKEEISNLRHETLPRLSRASARMLTWCTLLLLSTACIYAFRSSLLPDHFFKDSFAKDAMRYGSVGLLTWMALADTARTVWKKKSLWIMVYRFTGVVLAVSLMEFIFLSDPGSINPLAFAQLTSFLTVFVSLLPRDQT